jgi:2-keto-4-pentenoate hydratase
VGRQAAENQGIEVVNPAELERIAMWQLADYDAKTPGRLACQPLALTIAEAYAIQTEVGRLREERGERIIGYKVGCTSKPIQEQLGVPEPIFGRIFDTGCFRSGACLSHAGFANLAVEGELAVRLGNDLFGAAVSEQACREAIEAVFPVIELHHYVVPEAWPRGQWLIASGGMHAGFVFDEEGPGCSGLAKSAQSLSIRINEVMVGAVGDPDSLISPIESLRWLTVRLGQSGIQLWKGQVILTGSPMKLYPVAPGSRIVVEAPPLGASCVEIAA